MKNEFETIQKILKCLLKLDLCILPGRKDAFLDYLHKELQQSTCLPSSDSVLLRIAKSISPNCIYEITTYLNLHYQVLLSEEKQLYLVIGPCQTEPTSPQKLLEYLHRYPLNNATCQKIIAYCEQQPVISYVHLHQLSDLLGHDLFETEEQIPYKRLDYTWKDVDQSKIMLVEHYEEFAKIRRIEMRYEYCNALNEAVKEGNLFLAYWFSQQIERRNDDLVRSPDPLRNAQNLCITTNTQLRLALEDCGVHPYRLDAVSGEIARTIEKLKSVAEAEAYAAEIIRQYCDLSQENFYLNLKPFSRQVVSYIKAHLSDNLSVKSVAKVLMLNPDYLSNRFHQEVGVTVIDFINQQRIDQSAALLKRTNLQIQQIASAVGYNNTSYFSKQFLKYRHMTPREFRKDGEL